MPAYDAARFDPPAPVTQVILRNSERGNTVSGVDMLLDSGADVTLVPHSVVNRPEISPATGHVYELMGFDGTISRAFVAHLNLLFLNRTFRGRCVLIDQEWGIIGRDILNLVVVLLDGPKSSWSDQPRR